MGVCRDCAGCNRTFVNSHALHQHIRDSQAHIKKYECIKCNKTFDSRVALQEHLKDIDQHPQQDQQTPLDLYFLSYQSFDYDSQRSPAKEFQRLRKHMGWSQHETEGDKAWQAYCSALVQEFNAWYGRDEKNLASWHSLCRAIGINPLPDTCRACRQVTIISSESTVVSD